MTSVISLTTHVGVPSANDRIFGSASVFLLMKTIKNSMTNSLLVPRPHEVFVSTKVTSINFKVLSAIFFRHHIQ